MLGWLCFLPRVYRVPESSLVYSGPLAEGAAVTRGKLFSEKWQKWERTNRPMQIHFKLLFVSFRISLVKANHQPSWISRSWKFLLPWRLWFEPGRECLWTTIETTSAPISSWLSVPGDSQRGQGWADVLGNGFFFSGLTKIDIKSYRKRREKEKERREKSRTIC